MADTSSKAPARPKLDTRLNEVHQTDLTEGRINQDFVDWLKTRGVNYLLIVLVALCAYLGWVRWTAHTTNYKAEAWREYYNSSGLLPSSLEDVASRYSDVGAIPVLARLDAAAKLMRAVQTGKALGATQAPQPTPENPEPPVPPTVNITPEQRAEYLDRADRLYQEILSASDQLVNNPLVAVTALTGRAAVAESRGENDQAKSLYEQAAKAAEAKYPELAAVSRKRAASVGTDAAPITMPTQAQLQAALQADQPPPPAPVNVEGWIRKMVLGDETEAAGGT